MKTILPLAFFLFVFRAGAQTYTPFPGIGAQWNVEAFDQNPPQSSCPAAIYTSYILDHDTLINGFNYINMHASGYGQYYPNPNPNCSGMYGFFSNDICAIRQDTIARIVYWYSYSAHTDFLLVDYNLAPGTSITTHIAWGPIAQGNFHVSSIDSVLLGSHYYRRYFFRDTVSFAVCLFGDSSIIEGIGATSGLFDFPITLDWGGHLQCFSMNNQQIYPVPGGAPCTIFTSVPDPGALHAIELFSNPVSTELTLHIQKQNLKHAKFVIHDMTGRIVFSEESNHLNDAFTKVIRMNEFPAGIYLLDLTLDDETALKKIVKE